MKFNDFPRSNLGFDLLDEIPEKRNQNAALKYKTAQVISDFFLGLK